MPRSWFHQQYEVLTLGVILQRSYIRHKNLWAQSKKYWINHWHSLLSHIVWHPTVCSVLFIGLETWEFFDDIYCLSTHPMTLLIAQTCIQNSLWTTLFWTVNGLHTFGGTVAWRGINWKGMLTQESWMACGISYPIEHCCTLWAGWQSNKGRSHLDELWGKLGRRCLDNMHISSPELPGGSKDPQK